MEIQRLLSVIALPSAYPNDNSLSNCWALGMVIYEAITGHFPFHEHADLVVFLKVLDSKRLSREAGFTNGLWEMMELFGTSIRCLSQRRRHFPVFGGDFGLTQVPSRGGRRS